jgi:filamentous hemagglutinin family protein
MNCRSLLCFAAIGTAAHAQRVHCGMFVLPPTASCVETANGVTISLSAPSRIGWPRMDIPEGQTVVIQSISSGPQSAPFASQHEVNSRSSAQISGSLTADGPLNIVSSGGINLSATGRIQGSSVFLTNHQPDDFSALAAGQGTTFSPNARTGLLLSGEVKATQGPVVALTHDLIADGTGRIEATQRIELNAGEVGSLAGGRNGIFVDGTTLGSGKIVNAATLAAPSVYLVSQGSLRNRGSITSTAATGVVSLTAGEQGSTHEGSPGSVINTNQLIVKGPVRIAGPVIDPDDGANRSAITTVRSIPDLTKSGQTRTVTTVDATRLNYNQLQGQQSASLITKTIPSESSLRSGTDSPKKKAPVAAKSQETRGTVVRRGFFGTVTR